MTFAAWLRRFRSERGALGDLARKVEHDPDFPRHARLWGTILEHVKDTVVEGAASRAYGAYREAEKVEKHRRFAAKIAARDARRGSTLEGARSESSNGGQGTTTESVASHPPGE